MGNGAGDIRFPVAAALAGCLLGLLGIAGAHASSGGISGQSQDGCQGCHSAGAFPGYTARTNSQVGGQTVVAPSANPVFTVSASGGSAPKAGFNASVDIGALTAGSDNHLDAGELTHDSPGKLTTSGAVSWSFTFNAPDSVGTGNLFVCVNPVENTAPLDMENDGPSDCDVHSITVNTAPNADNDSASVAEDGSVCVNVLAGDTSGSSGDEEGDTVTLFSAGSATPAGSTAVVGGGSCTASQVRYTPPANYSGAGGFSYTIRDFLNSASFQDSASVTVTVSAVNDAPAVSAPSSIVVTEDVATGLAGISVSDIDAGGGSLTLTMGVPSGSISSPSCSGVTAGGSATARTLTGTVSNLNACLGGAARPTFTTASNSTASVTLSLSVSDNGNTGSGGALTGSDSVTLNVTAVNDNPVAVNDQFPEPPLLIREDDDPVLLDVLANDTDSDGGSLEVVAPLTQGSAGGQVAISQPGADNAVLYTPAPDFNGSETFTYTVEDATGLTSTFPGTVEVTVVPVNDPPTITSAADTSADDAVAYQYQVTAADTADSAFDTVFSYALSGAVPTDDDGTGPGTAMAISTSTGLITWTPPISPSLAPYTVGPITVTVTDSGGGEVPERLLTATQTFSITVVAPDTDGDGMPDSFENAEGFDPADGDDGALDRDGDGRSNADEYTQGTDPDADDVEPTLAIPADLVVPSTGFLTAVALGTASAGDVKDGALNVQGPTPAGPFRPGRHAVRYVATDQAGNSVTADQQLDVLPRVELGTDQVSGEGRTIDIPVLLNGPAPAYPVTVTYTVGGSANAADHDATGGQVTIGSGTQALISVAIAADGITESDETLVLTLTGASGSVLGTRVAQTTRLVDGNAPPRAQLGVQQGGETRTWIAANQGPVSVTVTAQEPNAGDVVTRDFGGTDDALGAPAGDVAGFSFDPSGLAPGRYRVHVVVRDAANAATSAELVLRILASAPALGTSDADGDGVADDDEGIEDADGDGAPDYADRYAEPFVLSASGGAPSTSAQLETEAALSLRLGPTAIAAGRSGASISSADLAAHGGADGGPVGNAVDAFQNVGGLFDFEITGVAVGGTADVVVPLQAALRPGSRWRKYAPGSGWRDFVTDAQNRVASALAPDGVCPAPGSNAYVGGLTALHACVRLTLQDGGPNDADGEANGRIRDPGGAAVAPAEPPEPPPSGKSGGGGVLSPFVLVVLSALALLGVARRRRSLPWRDGA